MWRSLRSSGIGPNCKKIKIRRETANIDDLITEERNDKFRIEGKVGREI